MEDSRKMNKRNLYIDVIKGLAMILVVIGHLDTKGQFSRDMIYAFHMPLFFILSGLFVHTESDFKSYFAKTFKTLYVPYAVFVMFDLVLCCISSLVKGNSLSIDVIKSDLLALAGFGFCKHNRALWFLFALFVIKIVYYFVSRHIVLKVLTMLAAGAFVFFAGGMEARKGLLFAVLLPGLFFFIFGNLLKKQVLSMPDYVKRAPVPFAAVSIAVAALFLYSVSRNLCIDMTQYIYGNPILYYLNSFLGTFVVMVLCCYLTRLNSTHFSILPNFLSSIGKNSLFVLVIHYPIARAILPALIERMGYGEYLYSYIVQIAGLAVILLLTVPISFLFNRYLYFVFGRKRCSDCIFKPQH